jgi:hypothetical protein
MFEMISLLSYLVKVSPLLRDQHLVMYSPSFIYFAWQSAYAFFHMPSLIGTSCLEQSLKAIILLIIRKGQVEISLNKI